MFDLQAEYLKREGLPVTTSNAWLDHQVGYWEFRIQRLGEMESALSKEMKHLGDEAAEWERQLDGFRKERSRLLETYDEGEAEFLPVNERIAGVEAMLRVLANCTSPNVESELGAISRLRDDAEHELRKLQHRQKETCSVQGDGN